MISTIDIFMIAFCMSAVGMCNSVMDILAFRYYKSVFKDFNPQFWNPEVSWMNKYKTVVIDGKISIVYVNSKPVPRFFLSTTTFVFLTDAWHLFKTLMFLSMEIAISVAVFDEAIKVVAFILALSGIRSLLFNLLFDKILLK